MEQKNHIIKKNEKGVALVWSLVFSMIILIIGSSMALLVIKELRITTNIDESNRAYLAAESGMEEGLYRLKGYLASSINWFCPSGTVTFSRNLEGTVLKYNGQISCVTLAGGIQAIDIESTGVELSRTQRKLRTRITFVDPTNRIQRFDVNPGISGGYYPFPDSATASAPLIIQQFDINNLNTISSSGYIRIGMANNSNNFVSLKITRVTGTQANIALEYNLSGITYTGSSVRINSNEPLGFRVKFEYARYGSNYTVLRASIFKKSIAASGLETFACATANPASANPIIFNGILDAGFVPQRVVVYDGSWQDPASNSNNGFVKFNTSVRLDNMVFWAKE